jgi:hypothetical protein
MGALMPPMPGMPPIGGPIGALMTSMLGMSLMSETGDLILS